MATRHRLDPRNPDPAILADAIACLKRGELVVIPTETVYGLAADPEVPGALDRIYQAKQRPESKEITLLVSDEDWPNLPGLANNAVAQRLGRRFWPGPLTLVVDSEGYRVPDHPVALALLRALGRPLAVTSANISGAPPAATADAAAEDLGDAVALILDAGPAPGGVPSTVGRITPDGLECIREGAIPWQTLIS